MNCIENAKYLQALDDIKPKAAALLSDSKYQELLNQLKEKDALIESLQSSLASMKESLDTLNLTVKDLNQTNINNQKQNAKLLSLVEKLTKELETYKARMGRSNQETFGSKSLNRKHKATAKKTRAEEKDDWTSKDDDKKNPPSAPVVSTEGVDQKKVKSENLTKRGVRSSKYNRMNAAKVIYLETTLDTAPENMIFLPSTHCTPEFLSDLAIEHFMMFIPYYREQIRHGLDNFSISKNTNRFPHLYDNEDNDSRGKRPIETFLGDYSGAIQSDGYTVYKHLTLSEGEVIHIMCWAHVRNKLEQAYRYSKDLNADWLVKKIGELYRIEAECIISHMNAAQIKER